MLPSFLVSARMRARSRERVLRDHRHYSRHLLLAALGALLLAALVMSGIRF
jgi:hypothetical protein